MAKAVTVRTLCKLGTLAHNRGEKKGAPGGHAGVFSPVDFAQYTGVHASQFATLKRRGIIKRVAGGGYYPTKKGWAVIERACRHEYEAVWQKDRPWKKIRAGCAHGWRGGSIAKWDCDATYQNVKTGDVRTVYTHPGFIERMPSRVESMSQLLRSTHVSAHKKFKIREIR
jgi:hypothetical protein